jgi:hypothetical protein
MERGKQCTHYNPRDTLYTRPRFPAQEREKQCTPSKPMARKKAYIDKTTNKMGMIKRCTMSSIARRRPIPYCLGCHRHVPVPLVALPLCPWWNTIAKQTRIPPPAKVQRPWNDLAGVYVPTTSNSRTAGTTGDQFWIMMRWGLKIRNFWRQFYVLSSYKSIAISLALL